MSSEMGKYKGNSAISILSDGEVLSAERKEVVAGSEERPVLFISEKIVTLKGSSVIEQERNIHPMDDHGRTYSSPSEVAVCRGCDSNTRSSDMVCCPTCKNFVCASCLSSDGNTCARCRSLFEKIMALVIGGILILGLIVSCVSEQKPKHQHQSHKVQKHKR